MKTTAFFLLGIAVGLTIRPKKKERRTRPVLKQEEPEAI